MIDTDSRVHAFQNFGKQLRYTAGSVFTCVCLFIFDSFKPCDSKHSLLLLMATVLSTCFGSKWCLGTE